MQVSIVHLIFAYHSLIGVRVLLTDATGTPCCIRTVPIPYLKSATMEGYRLGDVVVAECGVLIYNLHLGKGSGVCPISDEDRFNVASYAMEQCAMTH